MNLNMSKCKYMPISRKIKNTFHYCIDNDNLYRAKDFGITIIPNLSWYETAKTALFKAHFIVGMIKRPIGFNLSARGTSLYVII